MDTKYKFSRSPWMKGIALALCAVLLSMSVTVFIGAIVSLSENDVTPADLMDPDYLKSDACYWDKQSVVFQYLKPLLDYRTQSAELSVETPAVTDDETTAEYAETSSRSGSMTKAEMEYEIQVLKKKLEQNSDGILYYASNGDTVITNSQQADSAFYKALPSYYIADNKNQEWMVYPDDTDGDRMRSYFSYRGTAPDKLKNYTIFVGLSQEYVDEQSKMFAAAAHDGNGQIILALILFLLFILCAVYLCTVCGRKAGSQELHLMMIDRIWSEVNLIILVAWPIAAIAIIVAVITESYAYSMEDTYRMLSIPLAVFGAAAFAGWIPFALSAIRRVKDRSFLKNFVLYKLGKKLTDAFRDLIKSIGHSGSVSFRMVGACLIFEGCLLLLGLFFVAAIGAFFIWIPLFLILNFFVLRKLVRMSKAAEEISIGVKRVKEGELNYRVICEDEGLFGEMAEDINRITDGLKQSVESEIRAERMKAELITNVSHDLKTPLTSIINYSDLLSKEALQPEVANDYVKVIKTKSEKLKNLTQDLFDISKAQSGNIEVKLVKLDLALLVKQALGEVEEKTSAAQLEFKLGVSGGTAEILGDGRLLSRAVENLIGNILKYSMKGTRVYIDIAADAERVSVSFKNIANYEMNFKEDEIVERFVRGDSARTTEGSGLGLAIAKSYVEACGGSMTLSVDGDLFKAVIAFPHAR